MALEIIPLEINGKVINKVVEDDTTVFTFLFYNKDGINITPARTVYTDEEEQIPELSTQIAYGVYIEPYYENGEYIFTFEYLNNVYKGTVSESDYENLTSNSVLEFYNSTVDDRLLPEVTNADNGKILGVVNGDWNKINAPAGTFVCTFTKSGNTISCDKTRAEILTAYDAGKTIYGKANLYSMFSTELTGIGIFKLENIDEVNNRHVKFVCNAIVPSNPDPDQSTLAKPSILYLYGTTVLGGYIWNASTVPLPPVPTVNQAGKAYSVDEYGIAGWGSQALPTASLSNEGSILGIDENGVWGITPRSVIYNPSQAFLQAIGTAFTSFITTGLDSAGDFVIEQTGGYSFNDLSEIMELLNKGYNVRLNIPFGNGSMIFPIIQYQNAIEDVQRAAITIHISLTEYEVMPKTDIHISANCTIFSDAIDSTIDAAGIVQIIP